jgi:hypothetical protein
MAMVLPPNSCSGRSRLSMFVMPPIVLPTHAPVLNGRCLEGRSITTMLLASMMEVRAY